MQPAALNLLVFRDDRRRVSGLELKSALLRRLEDLAGAGLAGQHGSSAAPIEAANEVKIGALLCAGELECSISDSSLAPIDPYATLTDHLARALVDDSNSALPVRELQAILARTPIPERLAVSSPEGFAHYALHPLAYADLVKKLPLHGRAVAVIGIRSIGTTLSAITAAAARLRGLAAGRITVRPAGHPYNRRTEFSPSQLQFVLDRLGADADFLIVDEGPGLSGSSFLSVAEALCRCEVAAGRITLLCAHRPDFDSFRADDGPRRARRFRWLPVSSEPRKPEEAKLFVGGGQWRPFLLPDGSGWPASWISLERLKYLGPDDGQRRLFKFLGLGHYGEAVFEREKQIALAGFGISPQREDHGFGSYDWVLGRPMPVEDLTEDMLRRLAAYCSFREQAFAAESTGLDALQQMAEHNAQQMAIELGIALRLELERPVIADGRMHPHEWLRTSAGRIWKSDCGSHGDDHFYPGPTDIAWDLAGAIVEWRMSGAQAQFFLDAYRRASGDDPHKRIDDFVTAYSVLRRAYCLMAANALQGTKEQERLERAAASYVVPTAATVST